MNDTAVFAEQGWKLHISASVCFAETVLRRVLPVLLAENANFKVVSSLEVLHDLNCGAGGLSQVGKFMTIYPNDDVQAVRLATALDGATQGLRGPTIPSDRRLQPGSLIYYRYGGFKHRVFRIPLGQLLPALKTPQGDFIADVRSAKYRSPEWAPDPFIAAGIATHPVSPNPLICDQYLIVSTLHRSARGSIYLAMDIQSPRSCVLKQANVDSFVTEDGRDAQDRLRHEAEVLRRLSPDPRFPSPIGMVEDSGSIYLAMEDLEGRTLEEDVQALAASGCCMSNEQVVRYGQELASALGAIHEKGFVYRDVKPTNVIVTNSGELRILDFEIARELGCSGPQDKSGTRGYMSAQQASGLTPTVSDDIYGLGALMYYMTTGADPSHAPRPFALLDRPISLLNPDIWPKLREVIGGCLTSDVARRFVSMDQLSSALTAVDADRSIDHADMGGDRPFRSELDSAQHYKTLAKAVADSLSRAAHPAPWGSGLTWTSTHMLGCGCYSPDLNIGSGGAVLALAEMFSVLRNPEHGEVLLQAARSLSSMPTPEGYSSPGLYVGDAGLGAALLRAGQVLGDAGLIAAAVEVGGRISRQPYDSPDLFNGTAGRLRFHLLLWDETEDAKHLQDAIVAGEELLGKAEATNDGGLCWRIPTGFSELSGSAYLGYAHGAAGIGDVLLDLFEACGDGGFLEAATHVAHWLSGLSVQVLRDGNGVLWPTVSGEPPSPPFWCHGATGIGKFFLHLSQIEGHADAENIARQAARAVSRGARYAGPTQCHGLAGNIEFLLDMFQTTRECEYLKEAQLLGDLLETFAEVRDGNLMWPSESPNTFSPDYMVGYAGVGTCLLRLSEPGRLAHVLSRRGFQNSGAVRTSVLVKA